VECFRHVELSIENKYEFMQSSIFIQSNGKPVDKASKSYEADLFIYNIQIVSQRNWFLCSTSWDSADRENALM
jgi:hypothetical protein